MIYVINHKSPDLDSTIAAIMYAKLKNKLENTDQYQAASAGELNQETNYILEKFNLEKPLILENLANQEVILVDHNEFSQAQAGIEEAKILEILDHHKIDFKYSEPIQIETKPWGSSCSIVADKYFKNNLSLSQEEAGALLAGVLVDTVITKSPTCTEIDQEIIKKLAQISGIDNWQAFGLEIFKVRSQVSALSTEQIIKNDFKDFNFKAGKFGIGQIETVDLADFNGREAEILLGLEALKNKENYHSVILFITDIIKEGSLFLVASDNQEKIEQALEAKLTNHQVYLDGILSRKKQVIPMFTKIFD